MKTREVGWNEIEDYAATTVKSNLPFFVGVESRSFTNGVIIAAAFVAPGFAALVIIHRRTISAKRKSRRQQWAIRSVGNPLMASAGRLRQG